MHTEAEEQEWRGIIRWRPHQPVLGRFSLRVFCFAAVVTLGSCSFPFIGSFGERGFGYFVLGICASCFLCLANVGIAVMGLVRRESPRWPAITGLALSALPALGAVYILCGASW